MFAEINRRVIANEDLGFFNEWQLICIIMDIWSAGYETTFVTLSWFILFMIHYPEVQKKVQEEIRHVVGTERLPNMNDRGQLPYTNAVLLEMQRYSNIIHFNFGRLAASTVTCGGCVIPKGSNVVPYIATVHMDKTIFNNPHQFKPERFLDDNGKSLRKVDQFVQFSLGKRSCIGESLARMELFIFFSSLMQKFSFSSSNQSEAPTLDPIAGITMAPRPYECRVKLLS